jgi:uncharacterized protein (DUF1684 family)
MTLTSDTHTTSPDAAFATDWAAWHELHETARASEHGFLAVTGLHWLTAEPTRFEDVPGAWSTSTDGPVVELGDGEALTIDHESVTGRHAFGVIEERGGRLAEFGDAVVEVAKRGGHDIVRPRHPGHPLRTQYRGTPSYAPDARWSIAGRYIPFVEPHEVTVGAAVEGLQHVYEAPGVVEFDLDGEQHRLTVFNGHTPGSLFALFTDETSGVTTYAANRSLAIAAPDQDGAVVVDFNRAVNLPCAYTDFATCPLPPAENRLPFAIDAGEQIPHERAAS